MVKKRTKDGVLIDMQRWDLLPLSELKKFEDVAEVIIPDVIKTRMEVREQPIKRGRKANK